MENHFSVSNILAACDANSARLHEKPTTIFIEKLDTSIQLTDGSCQCRILRRIIKTYRQWQKVPGFQLSRQKRH